ncbi:MAG: UDP-N-acetylmuramate dehydrogenase [Sutterella sp.]|nr:UDP-N-acetylmuramate dehydrogenase [Sutterella sp.]
MTVQIFRDRPLDGLTTFGTRATAEAYAEASSLESLKELLAHAAESGLPVRFLGAGANTVAMSRVPGLVIRIAIKGIEKKPAPDGGTLVRCGAGEIFDDIVKMTVAEGLGGLENLSAVPGTVGGAVVQNIGAYGVELAERLQSVTVWDSKAGEVRELSTEECDFAYRHSILKTPAGEGLVVLSALLHLPARWYPVTGYRDLDAEIAARGLTAVTLTPAALSDAVRAVRSRKLPDPARLGNAGSFFTNPIISKVHWRELLTKHPSLVYYKLGGGRMKLAAAWLIEAAGFKGAVRGNAGVYENHALILVNRGGASGEEVLALAEDIRRRVREMFGVELAMEPVVLG